MTSQQKIITAVGAFAIVLLVFVAFILFPLLRSIRADSARVFAARQELSQMSVHEEQIEKFNTISQTRKLDIAALHNLFVDLNTPILFLENIENSSERSQVSLTITPVESLKNQEDAWSSIDFEITGTGLYPDALSFIQQIENMPYLFEFKNVALQRKATGVVDFSLLLKVYTR